MSKFYTSIISAFLLCSALAGCQKEDTGIPANLQYPGLTGKWYLKTLLRRTTADNTSDIKTDSTKSFTSQDFFEFKTSNAATYSSTIIGKMYDGYYSANANNSPSTLTFKSQAYLAKYNVNKVSKDSLVIYQTESTKNGQVTTTVAYYYIYKH
ncbi:hypothetical protein GCM10027037_35500 [Mucilaginibacter koreensis]